MEEQITLASWSSWKGARVSCDFREIVLYYLKAEKLNSTLWKFHRAHDRVHGFD